MNRIFVFAVAVLLGFAALAAGIYMTFFERRGFKETTAVIEKIDEIYDGTDEDGMTRYRYDVYVVYTVDGKEYHGVSDFYSGTYKEGKRIKIFYNPDDPEQIHGDSFGAGIYCMIIGPVLIAVPLIIFIRDRMTTKKMREKEIS